MNIFSFICQSQNYNFGILASVTASTRSMVNNSANFNKRKATSLFNSLKQKQNTTTFDVRNGCRC